MVAVKLKYLEWEVFVYCNTVGLILWVGYQTAWFGNQRTHGVLWINHILNRLTFSVYEIFGPKL